MIAAFFSALETLLGQSCGSPSQDGEPRRGGRGGGEKGRKARLTAFFFIFISPPFSPICARQVKCTAISVPKAESVLWSFAGRELNFTSNNTPFYVQEEYTGERIVSTVTLLDPISTYFGDYNCTVTNSFGTDSVIIKLTAHSKFDSRRILAPSLSRAHARDRALSFLIRIPRISRGDILSE